MRRMIRSTITGLVFVFTMLMWSSAQATLVEVTLGVEVVDGPGSGDIGTIGLSYDGALISGSGEESLDDPDIDLVLSLFGQSFVNSNDIDFGSGFPSVSFFDGVITFIDFIISEDLAGTNPTSITDPRIISIEGSSDEGMEMNVVNGVWQVITGRPMPEKPIPVPVPTTFALMLLGLAGLGWSKKQ